MAADSSDAKGYGDAVYAAFTGPDSGIPSEGDWLRAEEFCGHALPRTMWGGVPATWSYLRVRLVADHMGVPVEQLFELLP